MQPIDFVRDFIKYYELTGIYDEFDKDTNKMKTSTGVHRLYTLAKRCLPEPLKPAEAARRMRELSPDHRNALIAKADAERVVDLRAQFARRMSENGGARGILDQILEAVEEGDHERFSFLLMDAKGIVKGPENV